MSTRSLIGVMHGDVCKSIYCHSDGYLSYVGKVLLKHYNNDQSPKANHLVSMGDMSVLGKEIGEKIDFNDRMEYDADNIAKQCRFYGRDRGETGAEFVTDLTFESFLDSVDAAGAEYYYIMRDGIWYTGCPGKGSRLVPLNEALAATEALAA